MSAAAWFREAHGQRVIKRVAGVATVEDWPQMEADARRQLAAQGCPAEQIWIDDGGALNWPGGFLRKPKLRPVEAGRLVVRSKDYGFTPDARIGPYGATRLDRPSTAAGS